MSIKAQPCLFWLGTRSLSIPPGRDLASLVAARASGKIGAGRQATVDGGAGSPVNNGQIVLDGQLISGYYPRVCPGQTSTTAKGRGFVNSAAIEGVVQSDADGGIRMPLPQGRITVPGRH